MRRLVAILAVVSAGCVTQGTHDALQKQFDDTRAEMAGQIDQLDAEKAELQKALDAERKNVAELQARIEDLQGRIVKVSADLDSATKARLALETEKSTMIKDRTRLQASVEEMKAALADLAKRKAEADARLTEYKGLLDRFKTLIDAGKLKVTIVDGRMVVALASDVLFASGSARLSEDGKASIAEVATVLASIPSRKFQIEGHTDNVPIKSAQYPSNWELAAARAITVLKTMLDAGMPPERISAASYGESKPAQPNDTVEGRAANRRIEIVVVPDLSSLPGFDELNEVAGQ
jgi:chemotaxis protein MotB